MIVNLTLGLCSVMSLIVIPIVVACNVASYRRIKRRFSECPVRSAVADLPWASMIGVEERGIGGRPLTLPMAAVGVTGLALAVWVMLMVIGAVLSLIGPLENPPAMPPMSPQEIQAQIDEMAHSRHIALVALPFVLGAFVASVYWQRRSDDRTRGEPDILAQLFPSPAITQAGRVHLVALGLQARQNYRIVVCAQNLFNDATTVEATFAGLDPLPPLEFTLPGGGMCLAITDSPLPHLSQPSVLSLSMTVRAHGKGARRVRFAQRQALSTPSRDALFGVLEALGGGGTIGPSRMPPQPGMQFFDGRGVLQTLLLAFGASDEPASARSWRVDHLWEPRHPRSCDEAARCIRDVVEVG